MESHVKPQPKLDKSPYEEESESEFEDVDEDLPLPCNFNPEAGAFSTPRATSTLKRKPYMTMSKKAGIAFPCNVVSRNLKEGNYSQRIDKSK